MWITCLPLYLLLSFNDTAPTEIYTLSLHTLFRSRSGNRGPTIASSPRANAVSVDIATPHPCAEPLPADRKSTRLNSSHLGISYAVFCLKKKKKTNETPKRNTRRPTHQRDARQTQQ